MSTLCSGFGFTLETPDFLTLHLHKELRLDPACGLALVLTPGAAQGVDLVDENDGWLVFAG